MRTDRRFRAGKRGAKVAYPRWHVELRDHDGIPKLRPGEERAALDLLPDLATRRERLGRMFRMPQ